MDSQLPIRYNSNLFGVPRHSADGFPVIVGKGKALFLCLDIPDSDKTTAGTCHQDMRDFFIPIQAFDVVGTSGVSETERVLDVVQVRDEELSMRLVRCHSRTVILGERHTSPFMPPVARRFECFGLNCRALMAPLCFCGDATNASLLAISTGPSIFNGRCKPCSIQKSVGIPEFERSVIERSGDDSPLVIVMIAPGEIMEAV